MPLFLGSKNVTPMYKLNPTPLRSNVSYIQYYIMWLNLIFFGKNINLFLYSYKFLYPSSDIYSGIFPYVTLIILNGLTYLELKKIQVFTYSKAKNISVVDL